MGVFGDDPRKDGRARKTATKARQMAESRVSRPLLGGTVDSHIEATLATSKRQSVMPLSTVPYVVNSFFVDRVPSGGFKWTLKAVHEELGKVYLHGTATSVLEAIKAMSYCVAKGDWRLDKY